MDAVVQSGTPGGTVIIPASKSHTIRALLIAALAEGESIVANPLDSKDATSCFEAIRRFGAVVEEIPGGALGFDRAVKITGVGGRNGLLNQAPDDIIDTGNSGTTLYLAAGMAALSPGYTVFTGDHQIRNRPVQPLLTALNDLGATAFTTRDNGCAPFVIQGPISGGTTEIECPTSQYLSSLMMALPLAPKGTTSEIRVKYLMEQPYAEITEAWMREQGLEFTNDNWKVLTIPGGQSYTAFTRAVPADFSSATFFACAAAICGVTLTLKGLDMNDSQGDKAVFSILEKMGCSVSTGSDEAGPYVQISGPDASKGERLVGGSFDLNDIPDSLPALSVTAAFATGVTELINVPQARLKETDRIACMHSELEKMGVKVEEREDGLIITGGKVNGAAVDGHKDHRIVMACAIAALRSDGDMTISDAEDAAVTFPGFFETLNASCREQAGGSEIARIG